MDNLIDESNKSVEKIKKGMALVSTGGVLFGMVVNKIASKKRKRADNIYNEAKARLLEEVKLYEENAEATKEVISELVSMKKRILCVYMKRFLKIYKRLHSDIRLEKAISSFKLPEFDYVEIESLISAYNSFDENKLGDYCSDVALQMVQEGKISNLSNSMHDIIQAAREKDDSLKKNGIDELKIQSIDILSQFSIPTVLYAIDSVSNVFSSGTYEKRAQATSRNIDVKIEELRTLIQEHSLIKKYAEDQLGLLNRIEPKLDEFIKKAAHIISDKDNIFHLGKISKEKFSQEELRILAVTLNIVYLTKKLIDLPLISENGCLYDKSGQLIQNIEKEEKIIMERVI